MRAFDRMWRSSKYVYFDVIERQREWKREREWKGEDRERKGGIPEIITQENDAKEGHEIITSYIITQNIAYLKTYKYIIIYTTDIDSDRSTTGRHTPGVLMSVC